jgi:deoxyribodipyrimidine photo-lyase
MVGARRSGWNFALQHAITRAQSLGIGLVVLEPLRAGYRWASPRFHKFIMQGMRDNARDFACSPVVYYPYVEAEPNAGRGLLRALSKYAALVVVDDTPTFFLPRMVRAAAGRLPIRFEAVDGVGLLPLSASPKPFSTAHSFRRHLHRALPEHLNSWPVAKPLDGLVLPMAVLPAPILQRWPAAALDDLDRTIAGVSGLAQVAPVRTPGGSAAAARQLGAFVARDLTNYGVGRNHPDDDRASGLSPWLHVGHVSAHEVAATVLKGQDWDPSQLGPPTGSRAGWWGLSESAESFLDQLVTWRELGHVYCWHCEDHDDFDRLPAWALTTLAAHAEDDRPHPYDLDTLDAAATHDPVWNAAQRQLVSEGRMHNYLRMLWGKKVLEWSADPREAWRILFELNNRYALDGRDPNSSSGIAWCFGRFDRAWGPERPIFGKVRFMSSDNTRRKLRLRQYLSHWGEA